MSERRYLDPASLLALPVWLCAAIVFPLQLGITGASLISLALYLAAAGTLLSLADAFHEPDGYGNWQVALFECLLRILGLAIPAALAFALGAIVAPDQPEFGLAECMDGGLPAASASPGEPLGEVSHPANAGCLQHG